MRGGDGEGFEMFKGKLFQTQVNKKRTNREAGRGKDKSSGSVQFLC